ncbi:hypothetical protein COV81_01560 [Candidatus Peregrinibacteria bacterium CG11_big_fil_rev_8_21_14_0_20_41_10]|nr:MAG: hypothetical protein COV81_01560 [Candidatus Peregrinibacteria bacterium CG11_big_fil_rev_8_21_14_0_20_41_10]PIZ75544.1 MAG: hypothetical protein COY06_02905 [Candidatus Peregrinibacteria bacterium CG_4_10_14_0_2_um_filter_41_8]PJC38353.1 MAG: hypothetical protein CO045_00740 [Candidatus Peregrinibacteria bacterium CG_4_9_14_0_2_um_filter_41_14]
MEKIINAFAGQKRPEEVPQSLIQLVHNADASVDDGRGDFLRFVKRVLGAPIVLRPNRERKPSITAPGQSCTVAQQLRDIRPDDDYRDEIMSLLFGDKREKDTGVLILHILSSLNVDNKKFRDLVKAEKEGILPFSHNNLEAAKKAPMLLMNGLDYAGNGLFNPFAIRRGVRGNVLHVFDQSLWDMKEGICSTNASSRAVAQFGNPREMVAHAQKLYSGIPNHKVVIRDVAKYNLSEL